MKPIAPASSNRIASVDLLKGLVMVIMALDHTRDYFHAYSFMHDAADPDYTSWPIFLTRWITHYCAPVFSFLAGLSAFFVGRRKSKWELSGFLFKRGLWLVFIELTIVAFGWNFDPAFTRNGLLVIWVLGISMIILSALIHVPRPLLLFISMATIFGHNLLDNIQSDSIWWHLLHETGGIQWGGYHTLSIVYPIIPWFAVMSLGYCFGPLYGPAFSETRRKKLLLFIGLAATFLFVLLRFLNVYGDPIDWTEYETVSQKAIAFLNPLKYPPSLMYLLMTLGPALIFLAIAENFKGKLVNFFITYGRVPFFYYILHIYLIHLGALVMAELTGFGWENMVRQTTFISNRTELKGYGVSLFFVYLVWIAVVLLLYPLCKKFETYKLGRKEKWWLSYL